jgi:hypothetical protein
MLPLEEALDTEVIDLSNTLIHACPVGLKFIEAVSHQLLLVMKFLTAQQGQHTVWVIGYQTIQACFQHAPHIRHIVNRPGVHL